jgi:hypothetical protein
VCNGRPPRSTGRIKRVKTLTLRAYNGDLKIRSINEQSARGMISSEMPADPSSLDRNRMFWTIS